MVVMETKIDATHRLQKDGRWEEASAYRAEQRQRFRAEGLTKKESNEKAWEAMILKFPDDDGFVHFMAMSQMPPICVDPKTSSFFRVYCRVRAVTHLCCSAGMPEIDEQTADRRLEPQAELPPASFDLNEWTNDLLSFAFANPVNFLSHCRGIFEKAAKEIPDDALAADVLMDFADSIPTFQRIVQKRFTGALCP